MTNKDINDFVKDTVTVFRKYRDRRPITDNTVLDEILTTIKEITAKYGVYDEDSVIVNGWTIDFAYGLVRELMKEQ